MSVLENINRMYSKNKRGGKNETAQINRFLKKVGNNRVLDVYLKYLGVTLLNTNTLVPLAFILGAQTFNNVVRDMIRKDQRGGNILNTKLPILDDAAVGTYLKLTGLTALPLSPYTLVPLGVLMVLYDRMNMDGGEAHDQDVVGGEGELYYNTRNRRIMRGRGEHEDGMEGSGSCSGSPKVGGDEDEVMEGSGSCSGQTKVGGDEDNDNEVMDGGLGCSKKYEQDGGSDFVSTLYSRGAANNNLVTPQIHSQFSKTSPYLSNNQLNVGGYSDNVPKTLTHGTIATSDKVPPLSASMYGGKRRRRRSTKSKSKKNRRRTSRKSRSRRSRRRSRN